MKYFTKIICALLCGTLLFALAACGNAETGGNETQPPTSAGVTSPLPSTPNADAKTLVVYFSMPDNVDDSTVEINGETLGNTQYMARVIAEQTGAELFRILPEEPYPNDHAALVDLARDEQRNNARPKIKDSIENFDSYDTIFVGYPNWWADMPMILYTFVDTYDFSGKTIITFNTHGGSGFSGTNQTIAELEPNAAVTTGLSISRNDIEDAQPDIIAWLQELGYMR